MGRYLQGRHNFKGVATTWRKQSAAESVYEIDYSSLARANRAESLTAQERPDRWNQKYVGIRSESNWGGIFSGKELVSLPWLSLIKQEEHHNYIVNALYWQLTSCNDENTALRENAKSRRMLPLIIQYLLL